MSVVVVMIIFPHCMSIVWPGILRITVFSIYGVFIKLLGIMLATLSIDHARSLRLDSSTGTMKHAICDSFKEKKVSVWIRKLSRHDIIDLICIQDFVIWMKEDKGMHVGKATLLKFCGVNNSNNSSK